MENTHKIISFRALIKNSWDFYKLHWKKVVGLFLPLEIAVLVSFLVMDLIPSEPSTATLIIVALLLSLTAFLARSFAKVLAFDAPLYVQNIEEGNGVPTVRQWYKALLKKIIPLAWVLFLVLMVNFTFLFCIFVFAGAIFTLASFLFQSFDSTAALPVILGITVAVCVIYTALKYLIRFLVRSIFATYVYVFEERKGLDAVTSSFMMTEGKQFPLFWRFVGIWLVTLIPFAILVFPFTGKLIYDNLDSIYFQTTVLHQEPVLPEVSFVWTLLRDILTSVATLASVSFITVAHYMLWKNIKEMAVPFVEEKYTKMRYRIGRGVGAGVLIFVLLFVLSLVVDWFSMS